MCFTCGLFIYLFVLKAVIKLTQTKFIWGFKVDKNYLFLKKKKRIPWRSLVVGIPCLFSWIEMLVNAGAYIVLHESILQINCKRK